MASTWTKQVFVPRQCDTALGDGLVGQEFILRQMDYKTWVQFDDVTWVEMGPTGDPATKQTLASGDGWTQQNL